MKCASLLLPLAGAVLLHGCTAARGGGVASQPAAFDVVDASRDRSIPVTLYGRDVRRARPLAVLSAGYGIEHTDYKFLAEELVRRGFVVAAFPSHLATDPPIPRGQNVAAIRLPFWEAGVADIRHVVAQLRGQGIASPAPFVLAGHSHGGDIVMLYAQRSPADVRAVFSLDNRRVALPRLSTPRICSARSSDQPADPGVLPAPDEQARSQMLIVQLADVRHDDMWDAATPVQKTAMINVLRQCLDGR